VVAENELQTRWAGTPWAPLQMAAALHGQGVIDTFRVLLDRLYTEVDREFALNSGHGIDRETFIRQLSAASEANLA
jgi:hypothetical protein